MEQEKTAARNPAMVRHLASRQTHWPNLPPLPYRPHPQREALGPIPQWPADDKPATLRWPNQSEKHELPPGLRSPEEAAKHPRGGVAVEVIQRLKSVLRDEPLLLAGVSGPFTLAAQLLQLTQSEVTRRDDLPADAVELAAATITHIATK